VSYLACVRTGAFSGTAHSLVRSLRAGGLDVRDIDLTALARSPGLVPARWAARREARRHHRVPWSKTAAWSAANQRLVERRGLTEGRPVLLVQTQSGFLPRGRYVVYTDRAALETPSTGDTFRRPASPGWYERERRMLRGAAGVLVMGPTTVTALVERYGVPADRVHVVGAAANAQVAVPGPRPDPHRLLFIGTQWAGKGGPELVEAFRVLRQSRPALELTVVGCVPDQPLPPGVRVLGRVPHDDMRRVFEGADLLVLPTRSEAFGIAFVEALESGLPCVGSRIGNIPWIVGEAGVCVPPGDPAALSRAVDEVLTDYPRYAAHAVARGSELRTRWTWSAIAQRVVDLLGLERQPA
jgi:glycosyltransferase involved in cell wall biosynthesis